MATEQTSNQYKPDYAIAPGESLKDLLDSSSMSQAELAKRTGRHVKTINEIVKGKAPITPDTAIQFERVFGVPAHFWNNVERNYQETLAQLEEQARLETYLDWLANIPCRALMNLGLIPKTSDKKIMLESVLQFFGVVSPDIWEIYWKEHCSITAFRSSKAFEADYGALTAWLRIGEIKAETIDCKPYNRKRFLVSLKQIRGFTATTPNIFLPKIHKLCAASGVALVFFRELPKTRVSGATRWLSPGKALVQMSLRYKSDDHLWFTFFHEAAHILFHGKRDCFVDFPENQDSSVDHREEEANEFSSNFLIPKRELAAFVASGKFNMDSVIEFSEKVGVSPGIVVGRLQHDGHVSYQSMLNSMKIHFSWGS